MGVIKEMVGKNSVNSKHDPGEIPPGFYIWHELRSEGQKYNINGISWSPDGKLIASASKDETIRVWDLEANKILQTLKGHQSEVCNVVWAPDGQKLASASRDNTVRIWEVGAGKLLITIRGHKRDVFDVVWSPGGEMIASASLDGTVRIWDTETWDLNQIFTVHSSSVNNLAWSFDGQILASASHDQTIQLRDTETWKALAVLKGHKKAINSLAWSPDGDILASASDDHTIRLWDTKTGRQMNVLKGHTGPVYGVSFSYDGCLLASRSQDRSLRLWIRDTWQKVACVSMSTDTAFPGLAFHPSSPILATLSERDQVIIIWEIDLETLLYAIPEMAPIRYTTARIVLVGDSGVGKTSLGWRLAHNEFKEHPPTHGQQFWVVSGLGTKVKGGMECEAILWDFSGKTDYQSVHPLFLDDIDLSLILYDPINQKEPSGDVTYWLNQLKKSKDCLCPTILIQARTDRDEMTNIKADLEAYLRKVKISGGFIATSAKTGQGLKELMERIDAQIPWEEMKTTVTTTLFKRIKEYVMSLREDDELKEVLVSPDTLKKSLEDLDPYFKFSEVKMMTALRQLETHGFVKILNNSQKNKLILLFSDLLANLASSFVLLAQRNPDGSGRLEESRLLRGEYKFKELVGLTEEGQKTLIDETATLFLKHNICFRETLGGQTFLVFPSFINEKRPIIKDIETFEAVSYRIGGAVENVFTSMMILLGYTNTFVSQNQWKNQAQYEFLGGEICGFRKMTNDNDGIDGTIDLVLYYALDTPKYVQSLFQGLFEGFLLSHSNLEITSHEHGICPGYREKKDENEVWDHLELPEKKRDKLAKQQEVARCRTSFETALLRVKSLLCDFSNEESRPTCFISYAWGSAEHERWVVRLAKDLQNAGIDVLIDRWYNPPDYSTGKFIDRIMSSEFVVVVGMAELCLKYEMHAFDRIVSSELELINTRLRQHRRFGQTVFPILLSGKPNTAFIPQLQVLDYVDFRDETSYFVNLLDLIWRIHNLPSDYPLLEELRALMRP